VAGVGGAFRPLKGGEQGSSGGEGGLRRARSSKGGKQELEGGRRREEATQDGVGCSTLNLRVKKDRKKGFQVQ